MTRTRQELRAAVDMLLDGHAMEMSLEEIGMLRVYSMPDVSTVPVKDLTFCGHPIIVSPGVETNV